MSDIADAISILIKHASGDAVDILLRNLFELEMNFEYLDSNYQENSIKFLYFYYRKKHESISGEIPGTEQNLKLIEVLEQDSNVDADTLNFIKYNDRTVDCLNTLNTMLSSPVYSEVDAYYFASEHKKRRHWYQLLQGPDSFFDLVKVNGKISLYKIRYEQWSELAHGLDIVNRNLSFEGSITNIISKRNPTDIDFKAFETISILKRRFMNYARKNMTNDIEVISNWLIEMNEKLKKIFPEYLS